MNCIALRVLYSIFQCFQCYLSAIMHGLNTSLCNRFPPLHMCILRTSRHHYSQFLIWDLMRGIYIKENEMKQARQKGKKEKKTINTDTVCKGLIQQID